MLDSHYRDQAAYHNNGKYKNRISHQDLKFLYILFFDNGHDKIKIVDRILYHNVGSNISKYHQDRRMGVGDTSISVQGLLMTS